MQENHVVLGLLPVRSARQECGLLNRNSDLPAIGMIYRRINRQIDISESDWVMLNRECFPQKCTHSVYDLISKTTRP